MLRYMLDTNVCVTVLRQPSSSILKRFDHFELQICISTITLHELLHGADKSHRPERQRDRVGTLISGLEVLEFDAQAADHSGNIHATLAKAGAIIGAYDMLIAGHARSRGLIVVTNNLRIPARRGLALRRLALTRKSAFPPVVAPDTRVLILGSLPGEASLAAARYYAHPQNQFWRLVGAVIGNEELPSLDYEARLAARLAAGIGLWDTVASAVRRGSLDAAIREAEHAPLAELVATLPALRAVAFNGATSARIGRKLLADSAARLVDLPSSSPAHAAMTFAEKQRRWLILQEFLC